MTPCPLVPVAAAFWSLLPPLSGPADYGTTRERDTPTASGNVRMLGVAMTYLQVCTYTPPPPPPHVNTPG